MRTSEPVLAYPENLRLCDGCGYYFAPLRRKDELYCSRSCQDVVMQRRWRLARKQDATIEGSGQSEVSSSANDG